MSVTLGWGLGIPSAPSYCEHNQSLLFNRPLLSFKNAHFQNEAKYMRNVVQLCLAANNFLLMRKGNQAFLLLATTLA